MEGRPNPEYRQWSNVAADLCLGAMSGLTAIGIGTTTEQLILQDAPNTEAQILIGAIATVALVILARKSFQNFWEEIHKPKAIEPPADS